MVFLSLLSTGSSNTNKSLDVKRLTKDDAFFDSAVSRDTTIIGSGQTIYWKGCTAIKIYRTGQEQKPVARVDAVDGEAVVRKGTSLLLEKGKVVEE
jgi:hypothetical protein